MKLGAVFAGALLLSNWALGGQTTPVANPAAGTAVKVLVLPFGQITPEPTQMWMAWAIQQNLVADLSRTRGVQGLTPTAPPAADALQAARQAGAAFVIFGSYQVVGQNLRITGQVLNVQAGALAGGLKASGPLGELFDLEDALTTQVRQALPKPPSRPAASVAGTVARESEPALAGPVPVRVGSQSWIGDRKQAEALGSAPMDRATYNYYYSPYYSPWSCWGYGYGWGSAYYGLGWGYPSWAGIYFLP